MGLIKDYTYKVLNWFLFIFIVLGSSLYTEFIFFILKKIGFAVTNLETKLFISIPISLSFMVIIYFIFRKSFNENIKSYGKDLKKYFFWTLKFYILGLAIMFISNILIYIFVGSNATNEILVQGYLKKYPVYMAFSSIIYSPFIEEVAFRKIIRNVIKNKYVYILFSGLLF